MILLDDDELIEDIVLEAVAFDPEGVAVCVEPSSDLGVFFADGAGEEPRRVATGNTDRVDAADQEQLAEDWPPHEEDGRADDITVDDVGEFRAGNVLSIFVALVDGGELSPEDLALTAPAEIFGECVTPDFNEGGNDHIFFSLFSFI